MWSLSCHFFCIFRFFWWRNKKAWSRKCLLSNVCVSVSTGERKNTYCRLCSRGNVWCDVSTFQPKYIIEKQLTFLSKIIAPASENKDNKLWALSVRHCQVETRRGKKGRESNWRERRCPSPPQSFVLSNLFSPMSKSSLIHMLKWNVYQRHNVLIPKQNLLVSTAGNVWHMVGR